MAAVKTFYLGQIKYAKALQLQNKLVNWNVGNKKEARPVLLLLQHYPVYTVGLRSFQYNENDEKRLQNTGADFVKTKRGGLITFHGPGQLVAYPIFNAKSLNIRPRRYIQDIERTVIKLCARHGLKAETSEHTGVWVGDKKICAIGINAQQRIYSHGLALNCGPDMTWFDHIVPCGIEGKGVTSLTLETNKQVSVEETLVPFIKDMSNIFQWTFSDIQNIDSDKFSVDSLFKEVTKR